MKRTPKKKRSFWKNTKGVISLFLCIILTPVLTLSSVLIEFSRHQSSVAITQELADASSLSVLANYDKYLEERFGLFAVSQDCNISDEFKNTFNTNVDLFGNSVDNSSLVGASGSSPLNASNYKVLKEQLLDFSENTVLTETIYKDLNIDELLEKLQSLGNITAMLDAAKKAKELTSAVKTLVEKGEALVNSITSIEGQITDVQTDAVELANVIGSLYEKVHNDISDFDVEKEESIIKVAENYSDTIKEVYTKAEDLESSFNTLKSNIGSISTSLSEFTSALNTAKGLLTQTNTKAEEFKNNTQTDDQSGLNTAVDASTDVLGTIINEISKAVENAGESLKESSIQAIKNAATTFVSTIKDDLGLNLDVYNADFYKITDGKLSDEAANSLKKLLSLMPEAWESGSLDAIISELKSMFLPSSLNGDFLSTAKTAISSALQRANGALKSDLEASLAEMLGALVNAIKGMFELDVFYDGELCAYINEGYMLQGSQSSYSGFLTALNKMMDAINSISSSDSSLWDRLTGIWNLFDAVADTIETVVNLIEDTLSQIGELIEYVKDPNKLYTTLLLSGYMAHNLPNRTNALGVNFDNPSSYNDVLGGKALTGFEYANIKVPSISAAAGLSGTDGEGGFGSGLSSFLAKTDLGGTDPMFMGAELEYILAGTPSEIMNQTVVFMQLYMLRLLLDIPAVFSDSSVNAMAAAATVASWAVYLVVILAEPFIDTVFLVNGAYDSDAGTAPLIKKSCYLSPTGVVKLITKFGDLAIKNESLKNTVTNKLQSQVKDKLSNIDLDSSKLKAYSDGIFEMDYTTHCLILMMITSNETAILNRFANLLQLEARYYYQQSGASYTFDINKTYTSVSVDAEVKFNMFLSTFELDNSLLQKKYVFTRGY